LYCTPEVPSASSMAMVWLTVASAVPFGVARAHKDNSRR